MKTLVILACILSITVLPAVLYADDAPAAGKPTEVLQKGVVNTTLKEPAGVDWATGKGRKDSVVKWAVADNYLKKTPGMFLRGFSNAAFGWAEVLTQPVRWSKNAPLGLGTTMGLIMGPLQATLRTTSGVIDLGTCWVPFWHGVPMSKPVLGLNDVHNYGTIDDAGQYKHQTHRYLFNKLSSEY